MTDGELSTGSTAKLGAVLKALRRKQGWTLAEVSRRTGLPISSLSRIENDQMSPTFDKLSRISAGLQVDLSTLFGGGNGAEVEEGGGGRRSIARAGEGKAIETKNYSYVYPTWDLLNKSLIPIVVELHARSLQEFGDLIQHAGEEYAFVLEGEVDFYTSHYAPVRLKAGDSIYFDSGMGHGYVAATAGPCRVLSMCSAPKKQLTSASAGTAPMGESPQRRPRVAKNPRL